MKRKGIIPAGAGEPLEIDGVMLLEPHVFSDERGHFFESHNQRELEKIIGRTVTFVQDNQARSARNVLRGLHYQVRRPQAKLVRVVAGEIYDVTVDLRRRSTTFGRHVAVHLSAENRRQVWIPEGCAHGYLALTAFADVIYKVSDYWTPDDEHCIAWNDPTLAIPWPLQTAPTLSVKDQRGIAFEAAETFD
jgi:dTDP-4-dehydrorhamnose 3,5-epimerase